MQGIPPKQTPKARCDLVLRLLHRETGNCVPASRNRLTNKIETMFSVGQRACVEISPDQYFGHAKIISFCEMGKKDRFSQDRVQLHTNKHGYRELLFIFIF